MTSSVHDDLWGDARPGSRRIMEAALAAFAARGYHGASTRDIAAAAGLSPSAVYAHHRTKEELLYAISLAGHRSALAAVERALAEESTAVGRVRALVHDHTAWHARHHQLARVVQYELGALAPEHRDEIVTLRRRTERLVRDEIAAGAASGAFRTDDVDGVTLTIVSLGIDVSRWYTPGGHHTPVSLGRRYANLVLAMLGTGHEAAAG
ncbi:TetR family transcriptional regulator [Streptomyces sp. NPDC004838]